MSNLNFLKIWAAGKETLIKCPGVDRLKTLGLAIDAKRNASFYQLVNLVEWKVEPAKISTHVLNMNLYIQKPFPSPALWSNRFSPLSIVVSANVYRQRVSEIDAERFFFCSWFGIQAKKWPQGAFSPFSLCGRQDQECRSGKFMKVLFSVYRVASWKNTTSDNILPWKFYFCVHRNCLSVAPYECGPNFMTPQRPVLMITWYNSVCSLNPNINVACEGSASASLSSSSTSTLEIVRILKKDYVHFFFFKVHQ